MPKAQKLIYSHAGRHKIEILFSQTSKRYFPHPATNIKMSTIEEIIANVADRLKYARTAPQTTEDYWSLFTPNINPSIINTDIITTSATVKSAIDQHAILSQLAPANKDIVITYIVFEMLA